MIKIKETFSNGLFDCYRIYSDRDMKILDKKNREPYNWSYEVMLEVAASRYPQDYEETNIPIEPIILPRIEK